MKGKALTYAQLLRKPRWQYTRLQVLNRDHWQCQRCGTLEHELQVHHRWYEQGQPWDVPLEALITLCNSCHEEVSMTPAVPNLTEKSIMHLSRGKLETGTCKDRRKYVAGDVLLDYIADGQHGPLRDRDTLWRDYVIQKEGAKFEEDVKRHLGRKGAVNVESLIRFTDEMGKRWWLAEIAMHCASQYDRDLYVEIFEYFVEHKLVEDGDRVKVFPGDGFENDSALQGLFKQAERTTELSTQNLGFIRNLMAIKHTVQEHGQTLEQHHDRIEEIDARTRLIPGRLTVYEFARDVLKLRPKREQCRIWGKGISKWIRETDPEEWSRVRDPQNKRYDEDLRDEIQTYTPEHLKAYFKGLGYTP